jgi:hypothetical protein
MYELIFALLMLIATVAVAEGADNYNCGASTCICTGSIECQDMRNSVKCGGEVACHTSSKNQLICTCRRQDLKNSHIQVRFGQRSRVLDQWPPAKVAPKKHTP